MSTWVLSVTMGLMPMFLVFTVVCSWYTLPALMRKHGLRLKPPAQLEVRASAASATPRTKAAPPAVAPRQQQLCWVRDTHPGWQAMWGALFAYQGCVYAGQACLERVDRSMCTRVPPRFRV